MIIVNNNCINLIKKWEGFVPNPYHGTADRSDIFTIGYGTIIYPNGNRVTLQDKSITEVQAVEYLKFYITQKANIIDLLLRDDLTPNQFAALISFVYNLGEGALQQSTLRKKVNINPNDPTIRNEFIKWVYANGVIQPGLVSRRKEEGLLYFTK